MPPGFPTPGGICRIRVYRPEGFPAGGDRDRAAPEAGPVVHIMYPRPMAGPKCRKGVEDGRHQG
jgi:hypothetical protein